MDEQDPGDCVIAYYLARSISSYLGAVVLAASGKGSNQRLELGENEKYAANVMLTTVVSQVSRDLQQDAFDVHLLTLAEFWGDMYSYDEMKALQVELVDECSDLLADENCTLCDIGDRFWQWSQHNDADFFEELVRIYRLWAENSDIANLDIYPYPEPSDLVLH